MNFYPVLLAGGIDQLGQVRQVERFGLRRRSELPAFDPRRMTQKEQAREQPRSTSSRNISARVASGVRMAEVAGRLARADAVLSPS